MFNKLMAIAIKVNDFNKEFNFYKEILQLEIFIEDQENEFAEFKIGDTLIALLTENTLRDMSENINFINPEDSTFLFAVEVENLEDTYAKLKEKGITFIQEPKSTSWGQKVSYFKDPEGYTWEISETPKEG